MNINHKIFACHDEQIIAYNAIINNDDINKAILELDNFDMQKTPLITKKCFYPQKDFAKKIYIVSRTPLEEINDKQVYCYKYYSFLPCWISRLISGFSIVKENQPFFSSLLTKNLLCYKTNDPVQNKIIKKFIESIKFVPIENSLFEFDKAVQSETKIDETRKGHEMFIEKRIKDENSFVASEYEKTNLKEKIKSCLVPHQKINEKPNVSFKMLKKIFRLKIKNC